MAGTYIYFVATKTKEQRVVLCRWVERFYEDGKRVQVVVDSPQAAQHMDQLLWSFSQSSFIPHRIISSRSAGDIVEPVAITVGEVFLEGFDVLVCDGRPNLGFMGRYPLAVHFVLLDDIEQRQESRMLWQTAREQGFQLEHVAQRSAEDMDGRG